MIVPGNIREWPHGLDRAALGSQILDELDGLVDEAMEVVELACSKSRSKSWEGVDLLQLKDRCAIVRQELDIMKRLIKLPGKDEIHDSH